MRRLGVFLVAAVCSSCRLVSPPSPAAPEPIQPRLVESHPDARVVAYFVGDSGHAELGDPVMEGLRAAVGESLRRLPGESVFVVLLGDNVYPSGTAVDSDVLPGPLAAVLERHAVRP